MTEENKTLTTYSDILPSDPIVLDALRGVVTEVTEHMTHIAAYRDLIKNVIKDFHSEHKEVDKKLIRQLARVKFKDNLREVVQGANDTAIAMKQLFNQIVDDGEDDEQDED